MSTRGKIFVDYWIQCGKCEYMEALAESSSKAATAARKQRGWIFKRYYGYVCPECAQIMLGASFITSNATRMEG
jgi:hypothetical protein